MTFSPTRRRVLLAGSGFVLLLVVLVLLLRQVLIGLAVGLILHGAGASGISYRVQRVTPWHVVVEDVGFQLGPERLAIKRVTLTRPHWWTPSLGTLAIEQMTAPVDLAGLAVKGPPASAEPKSGAKGAAAAVPLDAISLDGQLLVGAASRPGQSLELKVSAQPSAPAAWTGNVSVAGPGAGLTGNFTYGLVDGDLAFRAPEITFDLKTWLGFLQPIMPGPFGGWDLAGKFNGSAEGHVAGGKVVANALVHLREGRAEQAKPAITAEGIEADFAVSDLAGVVTQPGNLRIRELRTGKLELSNLDFQLAFDGADRITVTHGSCQALGGTVSVEPFVYVPSRADLEVVLLVDGIDVEAVMALTKDLPATATGRVSGRFPIRLNSAGLQFGTGWLALKPGVSAQLQLNAKGLLTSGMAPNSPSFAVLQRVESGLLLLKVSELRLDLRPPNAPPGRTAQLHVVGEPVDPTVKAPVTLDLNVNGPIEKLLNMGMDSRLNFGPKP